MPYILKTEDGTEYNIDVTNRMDFEFANSVIVYESIGEDGGYTINNGRVNSSLSLNASLATRSIDEAYALVNRLRKVKGPVLIAGKSKNLGKLFGKYLIESIPGNVEDGSEMVRITLNLREYRQANVKRNVINQVYDGGDAVIEFLKRTNFISSGIGG